MFAALERLGDDNLTDEQLKKEIEKSRAISEVGKVIVESVKTEMLHAKLTRQRDIGSSEFLEVDETPVKRIDRPKAEYSNKKHG